MVVPAVMGGGGGKVAGAWVESFGGIRRVTVCFHSPRNEKQSLGSGQFQHVFNVRKLKKSSPQV